MNINDAFIKCIPWGKYYYVRPEDVIDLFAKRLETMFTINAYQKVQLFSYIIQILFLYLYT